MNEERSHNTILAGKYRILRLLGRGGTADVWQAEAVGEMKGENASIYRKLPKIIRRPAEARRENNFFVAVKIPREVSRFDLIRQEAELLSSLHHPGIPSFLELLEVKTEDLSAMAMTETAAMPFGTEDQYEGSRDRYKCDDQEEAVHNMVKDRETVPCLVMEYIDGETLRGEYGLRRTMEIGMEVCDILGYLHGHDPPVYYRDLKPANIMLRRDGSVVLIDPGSASGGGMGTKGYSAPELYSGAGEAAACSDLYSLGAVLHECLTGIPPLQSGLRPLGEFNRAYAGSTIESVLQCCCSAAPAVRWQNAAVFRRHLSEAACDSANSGFHFRKILQADPERTAFYFRRLRTAACVLAGAAFLFSAAGKCVVLSNYVSLLRKAGDSESLREKANLYTQAVQLVPDDSEGYERLINEMASDGVITAQEQEAIDNVLLAEAAGEKGAQTCEEVLLERAPEQYEKLLLLMGRRYYACRQYGDRTKQYLMQAADGSVLPASERRSAVLLAELLEIMEDRADAGGLPVFRWQERNPGDARQVWMTMKQVENDALRLADCGEEVMTAVAVYRDLGATLELYAAVLQSGGVPLTEMEQMTENGRILLQKTESRKEHIPARILEQAQTALEKASEAVCGL